MRIVSSVHTAAPSLLLTCLGQDQCSVYIEPWGTEYVLLRGDAFRIESDAFASGGVEVSYVDGGISIAFSVDVAVRITDSTGRSLPI